MNIDIRRHWIYVFVFGFGIGIAFRSLYDFGISAALFLALLSLSCGIVYFLKRSPLLFMATLFLLAAALGVVRFDVAGLSRGDATLDALTGETITTTGVVVDEPDVRETNTKLTVLLESVREVTVDEKALVTVDVHSNISYGDRIEMTGVLDTPGSFIGDDGRYFDYGAYLAKDAIFYQLFFPEIEVLDTRQASPIKQFLFDSKHAFLASTQRVIPDPQASLLGGLVVGAKQSLGENLTDAFRATGIIHIVVLSGYNVTIVAEFIMRMLAFLPLALTWSFGIGAIVLFALLTGASATIVRASIMAILVIIARATGRTYGITRALFLAGFVMVLHNPKILVFDTSFQLSFMATLGLIHLAPKLEAYFGWVPSKWQFREFATATIATQLFVLPILLYKIGELSLVALPVNLLVLVSVPLTMLLGFLTGIVGFISTTLSLPFAWASTLLLSYQLLVVDLFANVPFASVYIRTFPLWAVFLTYVGYGWLLLIWRKKRN